MFGFFIAKHYICCTFMPTKNKTKMKNTIKILLFLLVAIYTKTNAQNDTINKLEGVIITSNRIELPFSKNSRTIQLISAEEIKQLPVTNITDLLQMVAGIDVRRRGVDGMQSDLYIRGGNFEQTLVLIDGIKMDDPQTGHHTMNTIVEINSIERIEIIKGPAARIYGQKAFAGVVNIITKKSVGNSLQYTQNYGSYDNKKVLLDATYQFNEDANILASVGYQTSDGYRYNTDFVNKNALIKTQVKNYTVLASFTERKFGANGFYASPKFKDQYEELQTSLVAVSANYQSEKLKISPKIYWRRNQDMYLFIRSNPAYYKNLHINNRVGVAINTTFNSSIGKTGFGAEVSRTFLVSNRLGNHNRTEITGYLEHRFEFNNFDITPGVSVSYFSDVDTKAFPGLDLGYKISDKFKIYGNAGYTYRIPTFTDLYYVSRSELGNPNLKPETAISEEIGLKYNNENNTFFADLIFFNRDTKNFIDWAKDNNTTDTRWKANNFGKVNTRGIEFLFNYKYTLLNIPQTLKANYTYMNDEIKKANFDQIRYTLNSFKHQVNGSLTLKYSNVFSHNIAYKYVERANKENYSVLDSKLTAKIDDRFTIFFAANNIFNTSYTETNLVPMPKANFTGGFTFKIY